VEIGYLVWRIGLGIICEGLHKKKRNYIFTS